MQNKNNNLKTKFKTILFIKILLVFLIGIFSLSPMLACKIEFKIEKNENKIYNKGDEIVVKVTISKTHRNCVVEIDDTDFNVDGLEIVSATKWKEVGNKSYERKFKLKVLSNKTGELKFEAVRSCERGVDKKALKLKANPL
jgi:hypothetical protein